DELLDGNTGRFRHPEGFACRQQMGCNKEVVYQLCYLTRSDPTDMKALGTQGFQYRLRYFNIAMVCAYEHRQLAAFGAARPPAHWSIDIAQSFLGQYVSDLSGQCWIPCRRIQHKSVPGSQFGQSMGTLHQTQYVL